MRGMFGEDSILTMDGSYLAAVIYGLAITLAMWLAFVVLKRRHSTRTDAEVDRGVGATIALVICALIVIADEATVVVGLALVVYVLLLALLTWGEGASHDAVSQPTPTDAVLPTVETDDGAAAVRCERRPPRSRRSRRSGRPCTDHTRRSERAEA
ncbi:MAG: hypothetical protein ACR2O6_06255 [Ilumatobacteraceae bacterium]